MRNLHTTTCEAAAGPKHALMSHKIKFASAITQTKGNILYGNICAIPACMGYPYMCDAHVTYSWKDIYQLSRLTVVSPPMAK